MRDNFKLTKSLTFHSESELEDDDFPTETHPRTPSFDGEEPPFPSPQLSSEDVENRRLDEVVTSALEKMKRMEEDEYVEVRSIMQTSPCENDAALHNSKFRRFETVNERLDNILKVASKESGKGTDHHNEICVANIDAEKDPRLSEDGEDPCKECRVNDENSTIKTLRNAVGNEFDATESPELFDSSDSSDSDDLSAEILQESALYDSDDEVNGIVCEEYVRSLPCKLQISAGLLRRNGERSNQMRRNYMEFDNGRGSEVLAVNTGTLNTGTLNTGTLNTGTLNTGTLNTGTLNTGTSNTSTLNTGTLNTGTLNTGTLNTGTWNTGTSNTSTLNTGTLNTSTLNTGTLNTGTLNTGTSNTSTLNTGTLNTGTLNTGTLNTGTLNTGTLNTGTSNTSTLNTGTLNTSTLNTGTLNKGHSSSKHSKTLQQDENAGLNCDSTRDDQLRGEDAVKKQANFETVASVCAEFVANSSPKTSAQKEGDSIENVSRSDHCYVDESVPLDSYHKQKSKCSLVPSTSKKQRNSSPKQTRSEKVGTIPKDLSTQTMANKSAPQSRPDLQNIANKQNDSGLSCSLPIKVRSTSNNEGCAETSFDNQELQKNPKQLTSHGQSARFTVSHPNSESRNLRSKRKENISTAISHLHINDSCQSSILAGNHSNKRSRVLSSQDRVHDTGGWSVESCSREVSSSWKPSSGVVSQRILRSRKRNCEVLGSEEQYSGRNAIQGYDNFKERISRINKGKFSGVLRSLPLKRYYEQISKVSTSEVESSEVRCSSRTHRKGKDSGVLRSSPVIHYGEQTNSEVSTSAEESSGVRCSSNDSNDPISRTHCKGKYSGALRSLPVIHYDKQTNSEVSNSEEDSFEVRNSESAFYKSTSCSDSASSEEWVPLRFTGRFKRKKYTRIAGSTSKSNKTGERASKRHRCAESSRKIVQRL